MKLTEEDARSQAEEQRKRLEPLLNQKEAVKRLTSRIDSLRSQNADLLEALETISNVADTPYPISNQWLAHFATEAIRKAKEK